MTFAGKPIVDADSAGDDASMRAQNVPFTPPLPRHTAAAGASANKRASNNDDAGEAEDQRSLSTAERFQQACLRARELNDDSLLCLSASEHDFEAPGEC